MPSAPPSTAASPSPWILGPRRDLAFVVLTPLLVLPLVLALRGSFPDQRLYEIVMAFGALGHHLPGMMRAYGDRELFQRFRARFLLAPIFLVAVCAGFSVAGLHAMAVVAFGWGLWHGWMQVHGFARIYDAKVGSVERRTANLDFALVSTWFVALVIFSPYRLGQLADVLSRCGVPSPSPAFVTALRWIAGFAAVAVTTAFVVHAVALRRAGRRQSVLKHLFLATTILAFAYATCFVPNLILGIALFEILHDVQYLAIVWAFNRNRVRKGARTGPLTRLLFSGSALGVGLYLVAILSYGALGPLASNLDTQTVRDAALGLLLASQLLHFYYDGFIWKMREDGTREALGIVTGPTVRTTGPLAWSCFSGHGAKWLIALVPILWLAAVEAKDGSANLASLRSAAALSAGDPDALLKLGLEMRDGGDLDGAIETLRRVVLARAVDQERRDDLARLLSERAQESLLTRDDDALAHTLILEARQLQPRIHEALLALASALTPVDPNRALATFRLAHLAAPEDERTVLTLARVLAQLGRFPQALGVLSPWLAENPDHAPGRDLERRIREAARTSR